MILVLSSTRNALRENKIFLKNNQKETIKNYQDKLVFLCSLLPSLFSLLSLSTFTSDPILSVSRPSSLPRYPLRLTPCIQAVVRCPNGKTCRCAIAACGPECRTGAWRRSCRTAVERGDRLSNMDIIG